MATGIPLPGLPGDALLKGLTAGSDMFRNIMNARYNSSLHPSGDVANAMYVEQLKNQYGENDPRYLEAKRAHEMVLSGHQSLMDYRTQLSNLAPYRASTAEEKLINASKGKGALDVYGNNAQKIQAGMVSGEDGHVISPQEAEVYNRALAKKTSDAAVRNKIPYAENVKITMDSINPDHLVQYSGPQGQAKYAVDTIKAALGNPPPEFMEYQKAISSAKTLSKQLRQFWGDSIQPSATDKIDQLTNPSHWLKNPQVAKQQFEQLKQITEQELGSFTQHGTSPLQLDYKNGNFVVKGKQQAQPDEMQSEESVNPDDELLSQYVPELQKLNPEYTAENIKHTAKETGKSIGEVIDLLMARGG